MQIDVGYGVAVVLSVAAYSAYVRITAWMEKFNSLNSDMRTHIDADEKRMQLLNEAILKLATEAQGIREAANEVRVTVTSAANPTDFDASKDQYSRILAQMRDQGFDETEAHRIASKYIMGEMANELE